MPSSSNSCVAVAQRRDPFARRGGRFHVGAGAAVYGLAQVVAQQVEHGQELPVLQRRAGLFDQGRHADQRAAQSVVQVARDIQPVLQPAVGQRQLVFAGQRDGQLIAGPLHGYLQFLVEALDAAHAARVAQSLDGGHADQHRDAGVGNVGQAVYPLEQQQQVVHGSAQEYQQAGGQQLLFAVARRAWMEKCRQFRQNSAVRAITMTNCAEGWTSSGTKASAASDSATPTT